MTPAVTWFVAVPVAGLVVLTIWGICDHIATRIEHRLARAAKR